MGTTGTSQRLITRIANVVPDAGGLLRALARGATSGRTYDDARGHGVTARRAPRWRRAD